MSGKGKEGLRVDPEGRLQGGGWFPDSGGVEISPLLIRSV